MENKYQELAKNYNNLLDKEDVTISFEQFVMLNITEYNAERLRFPAIEMGTTTVYLTDMCLINNETGVEYFVVKDSNTSKLTLWSYEEDSDCDGTRVFSYIIENSSLIEDLEYFTNDFNVKKGMTIKDYIPMLENSINLIEL